MSKRQFYDYEAEGGTGLMFPRNQFRSPLGSPFAPIEINDSYDIYTDPETNSSIWVIGGDAHCHTQEKIGEYEGKFKLLKDYFGEKRQLIKRETGEGKGELIEITTAVYKEGVVLHCKSEDKNKLIEKISKVV